MFTFKFFTGTTYITITLGLPHNFISHAIWVFAFLEL